MNSTTANSLNLNSYVDFKLNIKEEFYYTLRLVYFFSRNESGDRTSSSHEQRHYLPINCIFTEVPGCIDQLATHLTANPGVTS